MGVYTVSRERWRREWDAMHEDGAECQCWGARGRQKTGVTSNGGRK